MRAASSFSLSHRAFRSAVRGTEALARAISPDLHLKMVANLLDTIDRVFAVQVGRRTIKFRIDSDIVRIRARRMMTREPETLAWIDGFARDDVFWDVGSNIGIFSIYAATVAGARVVAFDPLPQNHASIVENIHLNGLADRVWPFCVALSDAPAIADLSIPEESDAAGGAGGVFDHTLDNHGNPVVAVKRFPALGLSVDTFIDFFRPPFPNHLKMDIDGIQERVIRGASRTLRDIRLKSVMLELPPTNTEQNRKSFAFVMSEMRDAGFDLSKRVPAAGNGFDFSTVDTNNFFVRRSA